MIQTEPTSIPQELQDPMEIFIDHYAKLATNSGWIDHARHQVMVMEKDSSKLFVGLGKAVTQRIKELNVTKQ